MPWVKLDRSGHQRPQTISADPLEPQCTMSFDCPSCRSLDLSFYQQCEGVIPPQLDLGTLDSLNQRLDCPFCGLVVGFLRFGYESSVPPRSPGHILIRPWEMGLEVYYVSPPRPARLLGDLSVHPKSYLSFHAEKVGGHKVSKLLLKRFLQTCETRHGPLCSNHIAPTTGRKCSPILLVDVENRCLVQAGSTMSRRYIALSYVWGSVETHQTTLQTTKQNLSMLVQENSLRRLENQLPNVICDALLVVSGMGERYLWVDRLCIVQDDPIGKHHQISQMDMIYSHSILTIVDAAGTCLNDGLCGVAHFLRLPTTAHVQGVIVARPTSFDENSLTGTEYETRAWTLQEKTLSRRCLFFTREQVFFRCNVGIHAENENEPLIKASQSISRVNKINPLIPLSRFTRTPNYRYSKARQIVPWSSGFYHYAFLMRDYTRRKLSHPSDILLAFQGLGAVFSDNTGGRMLCGLPAGFLTQALLWKSAGHTLARRTTLVDITHSKKIRAPSWSWAGWEGPAQSHLETNKSLNTPGGFIEHFEVHTPDGILTVRGSLGTQSFADEYRIEDTKSSTFWPYRNASDSIAVPTYLLVFTTQVLPGSSFIFERQGHLLNLRRQMRGVLFDDIPAAIFSRPKENFGFVVLSYNTYRWENYKDRIEASYWEKVQIDGKVFEKTFRGVTFLFVEWKYDKTGVKWAERISLGVVHGSAWCVLKPVEEVVRLA